MLIEKANRKECGKTYTKKGLQENEYGVQDGPKKVGDGGGLNMFANNTYVFNGKENREEEQLNHLTFHLDGLSTTLPFSTYGMNWRKQIRIGKYNTKVRMPINDNQ